MAKQRCPLCKRLPPVRREHQFNKTLVRILIKAHIYCSNNNTNTGHIGVILGQSNVQYAVMNKIRRFGFCPPPVDKKKGIYTLYTERIAEFLSGKSSVPKFYITDQTKDDIELSDEHIYVSQVKEFNQLETEYARFQVCPTFIPKIQETFNF